jgi:hypothetical protein
MDWTPEQAKKAHEEMLRGSQVPSDTLLAAVDKAVKAWDAFTYIMEMEDEEPMFGERTGEYWSRLHDRMRELEAANAGGHRQVPAKGDHE